MLSQKTEEAVRDLRYLLNRGYPRDSAVEYVSDHYQLELEERHLLARCVFSDDEVEDHWSHLIDDSDVDGCVLGVDGYNVLITVESILTGELIVRCDDGFVRDLQAIFGKYKMSDTTDRAIVEIIEYLEKLSPEKVFFFFDKQVSKSGELAGFTRRQISDADLSGTAQTVKGTDAEVWKCEISASSDRVIIERSRRVLDIPARFLGEKAENLVDLTQI